MVNIDDLYSSLIYFFMVANDLEKERDCNVILLNNGGVIYCLSDRNLRNLSLFENLRNIKEFLKYMLTLVIYL